jgi:aminoglycoside phosphotransferase (APT) family kinase protein
MNQAFSPAETKRLQSWLSDKLPSSAEPFVIDKFASGQSNPSYLLQ